MENKCTFCDYKSAAARKLTLEESASLSINCLTVKFKKGDSIIKQGTYSTNVAYLRSGLVKIHIDGPYHVQVVRIVKPSSYLGLPTTFGDKINQYSVTAIEESEVCFIDISLFRKLLATNPDFSNQILIELCKGELESYKKCVNRTQKQTRGKLADVLLDFADNIYHSDCFPILIKQEDIGNLVDASRETISRVFSEFVKDEILKISGKKVEIVNKQKLKRISSNG
ncbi:MAG: Crp/Fnr family transcriptional regulator [Rikenellaceae bacterium]